MPSTQVPITPDNAAKTFADAVITGIPGILSHQQPDGAIIFEPDAPHVYPQQAILPLAFAWAGLDPAQKLKRSDDVLRCAARLGDCLLTRVDDEGRYRDDSYGYKINNVDQRLTFAWTEALRIFREAGADLPYDRWGQKIRNGVQTLVNEKLKKLVGIRRFTVRVQGTSTNHVALYLTTVYRAGMVLNEPSLCEFVMPIARAMAADVHPDGYWDEHSDLLRRGGPTPSYNYLTLGAMGLMAEWTGEKIFRDAADHSSRFHQNFSYPDGRSCDLFDERVRMHENRHERHWHYDTPSIWGLFAMSHTPEGRACAARHMDNWLAWTPDSESVSPQSLARHVENFMYWKTGPFAIVPMDRPNHSAKMTLPAGMARRGKWCIALSAMAAATPADDAYRGNPFALERQKLFSLWHEDASLVIDGSHSKFQPENSTFSTAQGLQKPDYFPVGGTVSVESELRVDAAFHTFTGSVVVVPLDDTKVRIDFKIDPAGCPGPISVAFTMPLRGERVAFDSGATHEFGDEAFIGAGDFTHGDVHIAGPANMQLHWPLKPFHSYRSDHVPPKSMWIPRVSFDLTRDQPAGSITVSIVKK